MKRPPVPHEIPGEDRTFGGSGLYVDLVPKTCWGTAARTTLASRSEWDRIRKMVYARAREACEVCGHTRETLAAMGVSPRLHAHERYSYAGDPDHDRVQTLERLICQCVLCDGVTHIGRTSTLGDKYYKRAKDHAMAVNGWDARQLDEHMVQAREVWQGRSLYEWALDPSILLWAGARMIQSHTHEGRTLVFQEHPDFDPGDADPADMYDPDNWCNR